MLKRSNYSDNRIDILNLIPDNTKIILDVGCSSGNLGMGLKKDVNRVVYGVEPNKESAKEAEKKLDKVFVQTAEEFLDSFNERKFDCIVFADVLEHLYDPWKVIEKTKKLLAKDGCIVASIPNIERYETFHEVFVNRKWPYNSSGIFDSTHIRFFTIKNIHELFKKAGYDSIKTERYYQKFERAPDLKKWERFLLRFLKRMKKFDYLFVYQYHIIASNRAND